MISFKASYILIKNALTYVFCLCLNLFSYNLYYVINNLIKVNCIYLNIYVKIYTIIGTSYLFVCNVFFFIKFLIRTFIMYR